MKKVKNSLYLTSIFLLIILFGYFFHSFNQFNSNIKEDNFINSIYESKDEENYIIIGESFDNTLLFLQGNSYQLNFIKYEYGFFQFETLSNKSIDIAVVNKKTLYLSTNNIYLYKSR